jgi:hypothetical protein
MDITHMTYTRVAYKVTPPALVPRSHTDGIDKFLFDHYKALLTKAENSDSPMAFFVDPGAKKLFEELRVGSDPQFYTAAHTLAGKLIGEMDRRMEPGLLICVRVVDGSKRSAAVLKLEVVTPNSAVLERLETGEEVLEAVTDVLDAPGELQKGALVHDPRPGSEVVVGDKLTKDALYFPRAFGIRTEARVGDGTAELVSALNSRLPAITARVIDILPTVDETRPAEVLATISAQVPELTDALQSEVTTVLEQRPRPVRRINPKAPLRQILRAGLITIGGPVAAMRAVSWRQQPDGQWRITIDVPEEPESEYR